MADTEWRPLGVDTEDEVAAYDALHDGVPAWLSTGYWEWVSVVVTSGSSSSRYRYLRLQLLHDMCQTLRIAIGRVDSHEVPQAMQALRKHDKPLQIADYLLAHAPGADSAAQRLQRSLDLSRSAWTIGNRAGRPALVRRVPEGVQKSAEDLMGRAAMAGRRLGQAWEELYGITPNASTAYGLAIKAVEDAAVPVVLPNDSLATLGKVIATMESQGTWKLPMARSHPKADPGETMLGMMRLLWHGQHDRHGGQPSAPGNVSFEEAQVAVSMAVPLVQWFHDGLATS